MGAAQSQTFTLFPSLPTELRLKIWAYAQPDSRVLRIHHDENIDSWVAFTNPIALMRTCRESREVMLKAYDRLDNPMQTLYFDFSRDAVFFDYVSVGTDPKTEGLSLSLGFSNKDMNKIKRVVIDEDTWSRFLGTKFSRTLEDYPNLEVVSLGKATEENACSKCHYLCSEHMQCLSIEKFQDLKGSLRRELKTAQIQAVTCLLDIKAARPDWSLPTVNLMSVSKHIGYT